MQTHHEYAWAAVAYFYAGMQLVHAILPTMNTLTVAQQHPESHRDYTSGAEGTNVVVRKHLAELDNAYRSLYDVSLDVRYRGARLKQAVAQHHRDDDLAAIGDHACRALHPEQLCDCWLRKI